MQEENKNDTNINPSDISQPADGSLDTEKKSLSPEAEVVAANQPPVAPQDSSRSDKVISPKTAQAKQGMVVKSAQKTPPTQIGRDTAKPKDTGKFLIITGLSLAGLFVAFVALMVFMIASGGEQSPILAALGMDEADIKYFLLVTINLSFGFLALLFFVLGVIGVFKFLFAKKTDKDARVKGVRMTLVGILPLMLIMFIWMFLYNFINRITVSLERVRAEIVVIQPADLSSLAAPVEIRFSSENVVKSLRNSGFQAAGGRWDFNGDGVFETEITSSFEMSYLYNLKGNYTVGLEIDVAGEPQPRRYYYPLAISDAYFSAIPSFGTAPLDVRFSATDLIPKGLKTQSVDWDFDGDGVYDKSGRDNLVVNHRFDKIGVFTVRLRIVYDNNIVENYSRDIEVKNPTDPILTAEIDATPGLTGQIPLQIRFDGGRSKSLKDTIVKYEWDMGDGSLLQIGRTVSKVYNTPGIYNVTLTVTENTGNTTSSTVIVEAKTISSAPVARFTTDPLAGADGKLLGESPFNVRFDASGSTDDDNDIVDYDWDFGAAGATATGQKTDYTFDSEGLYTVVLTVRDSEGQDSKATLDVEVAQQAVKAVITANPEEGTAPLTVNFDGSASSTFTGNIVSYEWDFGDKSPKTITGAQISHIYDKVGIYEATLKVTTNQNETAQTKKTIYVREIPLRACFTPSRRDGEAPLAVTFDSMCSTGAVSKYRWDFNDGGTSEDRRPSRTFENPGTYNVRLEVVDDKNNTHSFSDVIVVRGQLE